jgi:hypothetical protein
MAVAEAPETRADEERAAGVDNLMDTSALPPGAITNESNSMTSREVDSPVAEVASVDQPRVVTFADGDASARTPPKRHRVRTAAREAVEENLLPRVERLRQASNVVLDEAAYDPSLRFVLIALVLFFIFLVILLVNNILG